jgi:hypothetical protein
MRKNLALMLAGLLAGGLLTSVAANAVTSAKRPASCTTMTCVNDHLKTLGERLNSLRQRPLRMARVVLTQEHLETQAEVWTLAAFIPTGSDSRKCLVTFLESNDAGAEPTIYCGMRVLDGQPGVWLHVFLARPSIPELFFDVAVYQKGAREYGRPIPCPIPMC